MNKRTLATVFVVIFIALLPATSFPTTQAKANHCHPDHKQTSQTNTNKTVNNRASNLKKKAASTRALNLEKQRTGTRASNTKKKPVRNEALSLNMIHSRELPIAMLSVDKAVKAVESGDKNNALSELEKALGTLITIYEALGTHIQSQFANNRCPIMGSPININTVAENLTRYFKGRKVAFCCAGCPSEWDKLTDAQKEAKLPKEKS
ncbi:MAG: hypothetical protein RQ760_16545 [Sedimentisphaerales bacterium]|nr:hypothetical protein [Sedimentisphaerales bacterium]